MKTKQITAANADEQIKQLYQAAFPEGEQIPWDDLMRLVGEMQLDFIAYYDGDEVVEQREPLNLFGWPSCDRQRQSQ